MGLTSGEKRESFASLVLAADTDIMDDNFYGPGRLQAWLSSDQKTSKHITPLREAIFPRAGSRGPTNWYRVLLGNIGMEEVIEALKAGKLRVGLALPVLTIESQPGGMSLPGAMAKALEPYARDLTNVVVSSRGHWPHVIVPGEVNAAIEKLLQVSSG